jgi:hypothetical protein
MVNMFDVGLHRISQVAKLVDAKRSLNEACLE